MKTSASKLAIIYQPGGEIKSNPVIPVLTPNILLRHREPHRFH